MISPSAQVTLTPFQGTSGLFHSPHLPVLQRGRPTPIKKGIGLDGRGAPIQPNGFFNWGGAGAQDKDAEEEKRDNEKALGTRLTGLSNGRDRYKIVVVILSVLKLNILQE